MSLPHTLRFLGRRTALFTLMTGAAVSVGAQGISKKLLVHMTSEEQGELVALMDAEVNKEASKGFFFDDDVLPVHVKVSLDVANNHVVMDMDERLGPNSQGAEMEDFLDKLRFSVDTQLTKIGGGVGITYLFGGKPSDFWYPEELGASHERSRGKRDVGQANSEKKQAVVISAGHGFYYHHGFKDWRAQREPANGVLEDDITVPMASKLQWALQLGGVDTIMARYDTSSGHKDSGQSWRRVAGRYSLEALLPENPEIWHSLPKAINGGRERDEDIRSRPLYANFKKADALISIHTNADSNPNASGTRVIVHPRAADRLLAKNVLCSMRELIHSNEDFFDYFVSSDPLEMTNKGENRLAEMPSVIVEVGFHTNPLDAEYLQDHAFQQLAMRGVAKGYRRFKDGNDCEAFAIEDVKPASAGVWSYATSPVTVKGYPTFPMRIRVEKKGCNDWGCRSDSPDFYTKEDVEKYSIRYFCEKEDVGKGPLDLQVVAIDFDHVRSAPAVFPVTCEKTVFSGFRAKR